MLVHVLPINSLLMIKINKRTENVFGYFPATMGNALAIFLFLFFIFKLQINKIHSKDHLYNVYINFGNSYKRRGTIFYLEIPGNKES